MLSVIKFKLTTTRVRITAKVTTKTKKDSLRGIITLFSFLYKMSVCWVLGRKYQTIFKDLSLL